VVKSIAKHADEVTKMMARLPRILPSRVHLAGAMISQKYYVK
jgi:hypothetical protein